MSICIDHGLAHPCAECKAAREVDGPKAKYWIDADPPIPQPDAAQAVVEAAEAVVMAHRDRGNRAYFPGSDYPAEIPRAHVPLREFDELTKAVRALKSSRPPLAVRPEEVEPGTKFKFVDGTDRHGRLGYCRLIVAGGFPWWHGDGKTASRFRRDDLIRPIPSK